MSTNKRYITTPIRGARRYPTIPAFLARAVRTYGDRAALRLPVSKEGRLFIQETTYKELWELAGKLATWLYHRGVQEGDRVAILAKPSLGWAVAFVATQRLGAVAVPLDASLQVPEIRRLLAEAEVSVLFCAPDRYSELAPLAKEIPGLKEVVAIEEAVGALSLWEVLPGEPSFKEAQPDPEDLAVLMYTSGTTGDSKGVMLCHRNITANIEAMLKMIRVGPEDRALTIVPWYHIYGLTASLLAPLWVGASVTYTDDYRNLISIAQKVGVTIIIAVPKLYHALWRRLSENIEESLVKRVLHRFFPRFLGKLIKKKLLGEQFRFFISGGAPLHPEVAGALRRLGLGVMEGYGLTETSPVLTLSEPFDPPGTVGRPLPGVQIKIDRPDADGLGEVLVRGPNVMLGYYKNPKRTREAFTEDGWFRTGDLGKLDEQGRLYLAGRKKNMIMLESGKKIYPEEVEWELARIPEIAEVLVYEDTSRGQPMVAAMVYPNWDLLHQQGITDPERAKEVLWEKIKEAQQNLAQFKRLRDKECLTIVDKPFEKSTKQEIKRHLYVNKPVRL
ncbi:MAG: AMP-dependent synthetase/ligase [Candidatus Bipolaricaulaceae bacterium]